MVLDSPRPIYLSVCMNRLWTEWAASLIKVIHTKLGLLDWHPHFFILISHCFPLSKCFSLWISVLQRWLLLHMSWLSVGYYHLLFNSLEGMFHAPSTPPSASYFYFLKCPGKILVFFCPSQEKRFFSKNMIWGLHLYFVERLSIEHYFSPWD